MRSGDVNQLRLQWVADLLIRESGVRSEWFQVFRTRFFDESDMSQVRLGQSRRFPAWRQRTGSAVRDVSEGGNQPGGPRQSSAPRRANASVTPRITSDNYFWFTAAMLESTLHNTWMKFFCGATLLRWAAAPPICPTAIMALTARSKIAKSENAVPPGLFALSRRPRREASRPRTLWKGYTPALESSRCRPSPWLAGRGSSCRQGSATVGHVL